MIIAGKYQVPDNCEGCPQESQWGLCQRCPVFLCQSGPNPHEMSLLHPDEYRADWAAIWEGWFQGDRQEPPDLPLRPTRQAEYVDIGVVEDKE